MYLAEQVWFKSITGTECWKAVFLVMRLTILVASRENLSSGFPTRSKPQKMAIGLKFQIKKEDGFYYLCSENKGADAVLRLCFRVCKNQVFS